jgi:alpha-1,2-mannosyltransferase
LSAGTSGASTTSTAAPPELRRLGAAVALFACSVALFLVSPLGHHWPFVDLTIYRSAGQAVIDGAHLYDLRFFEGLPFTYPPVSGLALAPLAMMPNAMARGLITAISISLLPLTLRWALELAPVSSWVARDRRMPLALAAAAAALWLEPTWTALRYGQIDLVIAALVLFDLSRPDQARAKGVGIGLATGLKLTPAIFVVYLLVTRRYRAAAVSLGVFAGTLAAGFAAMPRAAAQFWSGAFADPGRVGRIENAANQTLRGALARLLHTLDVQAVWLPTAAVVGVVGLALAAGAGRRGDDAAGFCFCALTGLLISPVSWSHHWVLAVPMLLLYGVRARHGRLFAGLAVTAACAAIGFSQVIWWVPIGQHRHAELHLAGAQLLFANAYVLIALLALAWPLKLIRRGASRDRRLEGWEREPGLGLSGIS